MPTRDDTRKPAADLPSTPATTPGAGAAPPSPPESSQQAALDKEAANLQAKADEEAAEATRVAADAQKAQERADDFGAPRSARCPEDGCRERLERYTGGDVNPHKIGTHFCPIHGRVRL